MADILENKMGLVGYADRLSVQPGGIIKFMVSSEHPKYNCKIVKLMHGTITPRDQVSRKNQFQLKLIANIPVDIRIFS